MIDEFVKGDGIAPVSGGVFDAGEAFSILANT